MLNPERLQKVLASAGIASRRDCEALISEGRVAVNGRVVRTLGARVDPAEDEVTIDGRPVGQISARTYVMLNKPPGVISTAEDTHDRPTVVGMVDLPARLFPVGRLDKDSEGLLLLTDDGELTQRLTHPGYAVEKEYRALLDQPPSPDALRQWRAGVELDGQMTMPAWVEVQERTDEGTWVNIVLREGRKRQIREVAKLLGYEVLRLIRVREGPLLLGDLPVGEWRPLTDDEVAALRQHAEESAMNMSDETDEQPRPRGRRRVTEPAAEDAAPRRGRAAADGPRPRARSRSTDRDADRPLRFDDERAPRRDDMPYRAAREDDDWRPPRRYDDRGDYSSRAPRREDRGRYESRAPRRDDRGYRDDRRREYDDRPPRRDDRGYDSRPPRREDRGYGERREGGYGRPARYDADRPRREDRGYDDRPPRREGGYDRPPRRDDRGYDSRPPRREDRGYGERREGGYGRPSRYDADRPRRGEYGNRAERNERPSDDRGRFSDKPAPSRAWRARQEQEEQARKQRSTPGSHRRGHAQRGSAGSRFEQRPTRGRTDRADRPARARPPQSDQEESE
jgi:23S rRNA pseudouridine2605 synthase